MRGLIIGASLEKAHERMNRLIQDYKDHWNIEPERIYKSSYEFTVYFKNGDLWRALNGTNIERCRGKRGHILLIDNNLSYETKTWCSSMLRWPFPYSAIQYY